MTPEEQSPTPRPSVDHQATDGSSAGLPMAAVRLGVGLAAGVPAAVAMAVAGYPRFAPLLGWDVVALIFVSWTWLSVLRMDATETATHATREEPTRAASHLIVLAAAVVSLVGVGFLLLASSGSHRFQILTAAIALASVVLSWLAVHTLFGLNYARQYYTGPDGGIRFNQPEPPRYVDFLYVAFTVGMSFAISDTNVESPEIRKTVLGHALLAYVFGSVILASVINLIAGI